MKNKDHVLYAAEKLKELHIKENNSLIDLLNYVAKDKSELVLSRIQNIEASMKLIIIENQICIFIIY